MAQGAAWLRVNQSYLAQKAEKAAREARDKANGKKVTKRRYKKAGVAATAEEAVDSLKEKLSSKINYNAIKGIFLIGTTLKICGP